MRRTFWIGLAVFAAIQFVPYGRDHAAPPITQRAAFGPGEGLELVRGACFDCHSNETVWPWYSNVAPVSWLTQRDIDAGRAVLNFSEWDRPQEGAKDLVEVVRDQEMPPLNYTLLHPGARLSDGERARVIAELRAMLEASPPIED